ncbi:hypothetical protein AWJ20_1374 [Sugiyamaella lignohabitans]|uniref:beta-glucosidase n=1 Tax=Sugiyamaella lignohabitans TaxID=796027 RepID=A0A167DN71_9ASCO|nr:uncharacterized protein AWJ20_1374 [Sugiyamaella lignohabitans]ANB13095.1 hypothetical protein AWJ20_1374 [Sugiyamaella lignohabitans]
MRLTTAVAGISLAGSLVSASSSPEELVLKAPSDGASPLNWATSPPYYPSPFAQRAIDDQWAAAFAKAEEFVGQLTLAEKVNITSGIGWMMGPCLGNTGDVPRLNFSGFCLQDGPLGVRSTDYISAFPAALTAGSSFNKDLLYERAKALALEHKHKGVDILLGPVAGPLGRQAAGGRNWEGFGADSYFSGIACGITVKGIQDQGIIANAKHFIANEQEHFRQYSEWNRHWGYEDMTAILSSNIDDRTLHEVYAWPFADMIKAGVGSVMCSYNQVNNSQACQNSYLLNNVLKEQLGFPGFVMSDWGAFHSGVATVLSGGDMNMPGGNITPNPPEGPAYFSSNLTLSVLNGTVPSSRLDDMAVRVMAAYYLVNLDETRKEVGGPSFSSWTLDDIDNLYNGEGPVAVVNKHINVRTDYSDKIAEQLAVEGIVLLKNVDNALPLKTDDNIRDLYYDGKALRKIGVLGVAAGSHPNGPNCQEDMACSDGGVMASGWGSGAVKFPFLYTPIEGINARAIPAGIQVDYETRNNAVENNWKEFDRISSESDVVIIVAGASAGESFLEVDGNIGDRKNVSLWYGADEQIKRASKLNSNVVVVINSVGPVDLEQWIEHPNVTAVLFSGPQGEFAGEATAQVLFGEVNPSGRLPFTIAKDEKDYIPILDTLIPEDHGAPQDNFDEGLYVDYKYFDHHDIEPRYEFGYGLSYSNWSFSKLSVKLAGKEKPSEHLPPPPALAPVPNYNEAIPSPEELVFPKDFQKFDKFLYPYIENVSQVTEGEYPYPEGYSTEQPETASLAGGAPGGNPALWEVAYTAKATIKNEGPYGGAYVAQLYLGLPQTDEFQSPIRQLRGFEKISLEPGKSTVVNFDLLVRDLSVWDTASQSWIVQRGTYTVYVGSSSRNLELKTTFTI